MKHQGPSLFLACILLGMTMMGSAFSAEPAAPQKTGLGVGKTAPEWTLQDQRGAKQGFKSLLKKGPVALVFYRSADW